MMRLGASMTFRGPGSPQPDRRAEATALAATGLASVPIAHRAAGPVQSRVLSISRTSPMRIAKITSVFPISIMSSGSSVVRLTMAA